MTLSEFMQVARAELREFEEEARQRQLQEPDRTPDLPHLAWRLRLIKHLEGEES